MGQGSPQIGSVALADTSAGEWHFSDVGLMEARIFIEGNMLDSLEELRVRRNGTRGRKQRHFRSEECGVATGVDLLQRRL